MSWFTKKITELKNPVSMVKGIAREKSRYVRSFIKGRLYFFLYDPKTKDELPYYDRFPLVLVLEKYDDGFLGLNLH